MEQVNNMAPATAQDVSDLLDRLREEFGLSQVVAAEVTGMAPASVRNFRKAGEGPVSSMFQIWVRLVRHALNTGTFHILVEEYYRCHK